MELPRIIIVLGVHRSGTSCLAGMLASLGLPMGRSGIRRNNGNPKGFFEDRLLRRILRQCGNVEFPGKPFAIPFPARVSLLQDWRLRRAKGGSVIGGKLPALGNMVREMHAAWGEQWKAIVTQRPLSDSARSRHRHTKQPVPRIADRMEALIRERDANLVAVGVPTLRVDFTTMMQDPASIVEQLISFVGLSPTPEQRAQAVAFVEPKLNHFTEIP